MDWTITITVVSFLFLFPLFLLLCSEYLEDYVSGSSLNEDQENDGGYVGMTNEMLNNQLVEALSEALHEASPNSKSAKTKDKNKIRKRRKAKEKRNPITMPRNRFKKGQKKVT
jgi:hypothetical protein